MISSKFKGLMAKIEKELVGMYCTMEVDGVNFIFHEKGELNQKTGIAFNFLDNNVDIKKFSLSNLIEDDLVGSRFKDSYDISTGYYLLTVKQAKTMKELLFKVKLENSK